MKNDINRIINRIFNCKWYQVKKRFLLKKELKEQQKLEKQREMIKSVIVDVFGFDNILLNAAKNSNFKINEIYNSL